MDKRILIKNSQEEFEELDLFHDESINLNDSIKDARDVKKIRTMYSDNIKLPASKKNNRIFKHYYDNDIDGFDARYLVDGLIMIGSFTYKKIKIRLNSVSMENGEPVTYDVNLLGDLVSLSKTIGKDKLEDLDTPVLTDLDYEPSNPFYVKTKFQFLSNDIVYPFISAKNYYFHANNGGNVGSEAVSEFLGVDEATSVNELAFINVSEGTQLNESPNRGILWTDLKPAIRINKIIEAIEEKYDIVITDDFYGPTNDATKDLFMWLHRDKGTIREQQDIEYGTLTIGDFTGDYSNINNNFLTNNTIGSVGARATFFISPDNPGLEYSVVLSDGLGSNVIYDEKENITESTYVRTNYINNASGVKLPVLKITSDSEGGVIESFTVGLRIDEIDSNLDIIKQWSFDNLVLGASNTEEDSILFQMPKFKVMDLLSNLFKMFNNTAYIDDSGDIKIQSYEDFYSDGYAIDITEYVDHSSMKVSRGKVFGSYDLSFAEASTFGVTNSNLLSQGNFGNLTYKGSETNRDFDGGEYKVELKFERMLYERMFDQAIISGNTQPTILKDIQWGWHVDKDGRGSVGAPLLMYLEEVDLDADNKMLFNVGTIATQSTANPLDRYLKPSNVNKEETHTLNFGAEIDEWYQPVLKSEFSDPSSEYYGKTRVNENSLFKNNYETFVASTINSKFRIVSVSAHLPPTTLLAIKLNNILVINNKEYKINSIKSNLLTGKVDLELMTKL